jgi:phosphate starvation-inducible protein PhoH
MAKKRARRITSEAFTVSDISPLTENQKTAFESTNNLILCGVAGSGKSFIACYFAINDICNELYDNIVLIRSAVPSRDIGFLPGTDKEKTRVYEEPYLSIFSEILGRGDAYEILKIKGLLHFLTTSYLRGLTIRNSVVIIDECQNMEFKELDTIITRIGENCRVIFCGDFKQTDLKVNGMRDFLNIIKYMPNQFDIIEFSIEDIVRSGLVGDYLKTIEKIKDGYFTTCPKLY